MNCKSLSYIFCVLIFSNVLLSCKNSTKNSLSKNIRTTEFYPTSTYGEIVHHKYYTLSYSEKDEQAEWVAYKLTPQYLKKIKRTNNFREDPLINTKSSSLSDYKNSTYDRGHLAPAASMSLNETSMSESFYMSNMSPQLPSFNRGIWKKLEGKIRIWVIKNDSLFIVTGPILDNPIDSIGKNNVSVPRAFYKTIVRFNKNTISGIAFIIPNKKSNESLFNYKTSIDSIEEVTGINFYYKMDSLIQCKIEANKSLLDW